MKNLITKNILNRTKGISLQEIKNAINNINHFINQNKWLDIEFKNINYKEITLICGEDLDLPTTKSIVIRFSNPSFIKSDLWIRNTLEETASNNFISIVPTPVAEKIMDRELDKENRKLNLPAETLFKVQTSDNKYSYIAAENIDFDIIN